LREEVVEEEVVEENQLQRQTANQYYPLEPD